MRHPLRLCLVAGLLVAATACGTSGRVLQPPTPGATAPPRSTTSTLAASTTSSVSFSVFSSAFEPQTRIPTEFTCDGAGSSPPVSFAGVPKGTKQLVLLVLDTDNDDEVHWLVTGMPATTLGITKGAKPSGGTEVVPWKAPCPTSGSHSYEFELLALPNAAEPGTAAPSDLAPLVRSLQQQATASSAFTGSFGR
jgi:hypothetical protein